MFFPALKYLIPTHERSLRLTTDKRALRYLKLQTEICGSAGSNIIQLCILTAFEPL